MNDENLENLFKIIKNSEEKIRDLQSLIMDTKKQICNFRGHPSKNVRITPSWDRSIDSGFFCNFCENFF